MPTNRGAMMSTPGFHGRGASRFASVWLAAIKAAAEMDEADLPSRTPRGDGPPAPRAWAEKSPVAARRLELARAAVSALAEQHNLPAENLLTPDHLRRAMWEPPATRDPVELLERLIDQLANLGSRSWQIGLTAPALARAVLDADEQIKKAKKSKPADEPADEPVEETEAVEEV
jgi:ribonuclease D